MLRTILTHAVAIVTLVLTILFGFGALEKFPDAIVLLFVILAIVTTLILAAYDTFATWRNGHKYFHGSNQDDDILEYMTKILSGDGRCVVSSNDLSWMRGGARDALLEKARKGSLELVMPKPSDRARELVEAGATPFYYGAKDFRFRSRFTVVNVDRADEWVAIGGKGRNGHIIREIHSSSDPAYHLATDLINMAKRNGPGSNS